MQLDDLFLGAQIGGGAHHQDPHRTLRAVLQGFGLLEHQSIALANTCGIQQYNFATRELFEFGSKILTIAQGCNRQS